MLYGLAQDGHAGKIFAKLSKGNIPLNAAYFTAGLTFLSVPLLYASDTIIAAFTFVTSICSTLMLFTWGSFLVSYLRYRKLHPDRHAASKFKMPFGLVMPWVIFAFFLFLVVGFAQNPDTRIALYAVPFWFLLLTILWHFRKRALVKAGRPITGTIPLPDYDPALEHSDEAEPRQ